MEISSKFCDAYHVDVNGTKLFKGNNLANASDNWQIPVAVD